MKKKFKKGIALNQAFGAVLSLVLIAVLIIVSLVLFTSLGQTFEGSSYSYNNQTYTLSNSTNISLLASDNCNYQNDISLSTIYSGTTLLPSANYTLYTNGNIILLTPTANGDYNATLTYSDGGAACVATDNMTVQFGNYTTLIGLLGTIIFLGLVIGVLVASFMFSGQRKGI